MTTIKHNNYNIMSSQYVSNISGELFIIVSSSLWEKDQKLFCIICWLNSAGNLFVGKERERTDRNQQIAKQDLKDHSRAISSHGVSLHPAAKRWRVWCMYCKAVCVIRFRLAGTWQGWRVPYCKRYNVGTIQNRFSSNTGFFGFP